MSLPHLPSEQILPTATLLLQSSIDVTQAVENKIKQLKKYVKRFWLQKVGSEKMSVFQFENVTNNSAESFHSRLKSIIKVHSPNFWSFLLHLTSFIKDTEKEIERAENGLAISRPRKAKFAKNFQRRQESKAKLLVGTYSPIQFLSAVSHTFDPSIIVSENLDRIGMETDVDENAEEEEAEQPPQAEERRCVVCLGSRDSTKIFLPCGHGGCSACVDRILSSNPCNCQVCRVSVTGSIQAFI